MNFKSNEGITLVELVVAMATSTLVFAAAVTLLLLGLRINNLTTGTTIRQNKTRTVLTVMERLATEGKFTDVVEEEDSWKIMEDTVIRFCYDAKEQAIYVGDPNDAENTGTVIMDDVYASHVVLDESNVLTIAIETEEGSFSSAVYCRMNGIAEGSEDYLEDVIIPSIKDDIENNRADEGTLFLDKLSEQYRLKGGAPNHGLILSEDGLSTGEYFSEWYITTRHPDKVSEDQTLGQKLWLEDDWNKDTPWCACFVSWGLSYMEKQGEIIAPSGSYSEHSGSWFASVTDFANYLKDPAQQSGAWVGRNRISEVEPGDLVFFDWTGIGTNLAHIGVVLQKDMNEEGGKWIYTLEGNSAGMVAVRRYSVDDPRIIGYGVLNWK